MEPKAEIISELGLSRLSQVSGCDCRPARRRGFCDPVLARATRQRTRVRMPPPAPPCPLRSRRDRKRKKKITGVRKIKTLKPRKNVSRSSVPALMATKFGTAGGIPERRVRPIWDAVDSRQFKAALKLSTALLAKFPNSPYALALKGLILERMGKPDEALSVCLNAKELLYSDDLIQIDDLTLTTLQIVFHRLDRLDLATSCYEYACGKFPNNLDLIMGLFNCYVREYSFVKQQQTAIKMYKVVGEERFLLWAVCSIQLQVLCGEGGDKLLHLAEALLKKHIASHSLHEPEALLVYLSILEQQAKYGAALEVLSGPLGSLVAIEGEKLRIQGRLLARARDYAAAADVFQKILKMRWCLGDMNDIGHSPKDFDFKACKLTHLTDEMKLLSEANNEHLRGPYLARLEIERRCRLHGKAHDDKLVEAFGIPLASQCRKI
ncbi:N-alpha-acetyltransferase 25, NatB auxiliary subunit [Asimina triloba]